MTQYYRKPIDVEAYQVGSDQPKPDWVLQVFEWGMLGYKVIIDGIDSMVVPSGTWIVQKYGVYRLYSDESFKLMFDSCDDPTNDTLNEAIQHLNELLNKDDFNCPECRQDHVNLHQWLVELRALRVICGVAENAGMDYSMFNGCEIKTICGYPFAQVVSILRNYKSLELKINEMVSTLRDWYQLLDAEDAPNGSYLQHLVDYLRSLGVNV